MKAQFHSITIICITILVLSSCGITKNTTCPTFTNKTEKVRKPLFSNKSSSKKKGSLLAKVTGQTKKEKSKKNEFVKIEIQGLTTSSDKGITLNSTDIAPTLIESKLQKFIYKKVEKKGKKVFKSLEKRNQKRTTEKNGESIIKKKKHKKKRKKIFKSKNDDLTDKKETHELAIISFIASISVYITPLLGILFGSIWVFLISGFILAILSVVWSSMANQKIAENPFKYKGHNLVIIAAILGTVALCLLFGIFVSSVVVA